LLNTLATASFHRGDNRRAGELNEEALAAAPPGSREGQRALVNRSLASLADGDGAATRAWLERALDAATHAGDATMVIWISAHLIWDCFYKLGRWDEALQRWAAVLADVERVGGHYMEAQLRLGRASILAARGHAALLCGLRCDRLPPRVRRALPLALCRRGPAPPAGGSEADVDGPRCRGCRPLRPCCTAGGVGRAARRGGAARGRGAQGRSRGAARARSRLLPGGRRPQDRA